MRCLICGNECVNKDKNICSNCSTSGLEYRENPPVKAKRISFDEYNMEHLYSMAIDNFEDSLLSMIIILTWQTQIFTSLRQKELF